MRKLMLATTAALAVVATPAAARDGSMYAGIEGGVLLPRDNDVDAFTDFTTVDTTTDVPTVPATASPLVVFPGTQPADTTFSDAFGLDYKTGWDVDGIFGYDFGMVRIEAELGYKRASLDSLETDAGFIGALNTALNRPDVDVAPDPVGTLPALAATDFDLGGHVSVLSGMVNALLDFGNEDGLSFYAGGGFGRARVKLLEDRDSVWAWQLIAGARYAISPNIDIGLKYRFFNTGKVDMFDTTAAAFALAGNTETRTIVDTGTQAGIVRTVTRTTSTNVFTDVHQRFRSHSLLLSLIYNFGAAAPPPPPPPLPPPPPPPPPATQTCPDGSVILATSTCPAPPPPPPPPPTQRGERGR